MQRHIYKLALIALVAMLAGCADDTTNDIFSKFYLEVSTQVPVGGQEGDSGTLTIKSDCAWTISGVPSWLKLSETTGTGNATITVTATSENPSSENTRSATLTVKVVDGALAPKVEVTQAVGTESLASVSNISFGYDGGVEEISIVSTSSWTISNTGREWLSVNPNSGSGNATIEVTALPNDKNEVREAEITIQSATSTAKATVKVTQAARESVKLSPSTLDFATAGGKLSFTVESAGTWSIKDWDAATDKASWCHFSVFSGEGGKVVEVTADANTGTDDRTQRIVITDGYSNATLTVTQNGNYLELLTEARLAFDSKAAEDIITLRSSAELTNENVKVNYIDDSGWITVNRTGVNGDEYTFSVRVAEFDNSEATRAATIVISSGSMPPVEVGVMQGGLNYLMLVTSADVSVDNGDNTTQIQIFTNVEVTTSITYASSDTGWLSISDGTSDGENINYMVTIKKNNNVQRSATITFSSENAASVAVTVTQAAAPAPETPTFSITGIQKYQFTANGSFSSQAPIIEYGVCVSDTFQQPTTDHALATGSPTGNANQGTFALDVTGLKSAHTYYVRVYVTSVTGTAYSEVKTVTTAGSTPGGDDNNPPSID